MSEDKWLDELLDRTEKEEILDSVKRALDYLEDLDVKKAYNVLELLSHSLAGYDVGKHVEEYEGYVEKVEPAVRAWSTGGTPSPQQHRHQVNHGELNHMHYGHDHTGHVSLSNLDEELEQMSVRAVEQAIKEMEKKMEERDKEVLGMAKVWEDHAEKAEQRLDEINDDYEKYEKLIKVMGYGQDC